MERVEFDIMPLEESLVLAYSVQQLTFREPTLPTARKKASGNALSLRLDAICAWKCAITSNLALLAKHTRQHAGRLVGVRVGHDAHRPGAHPEMK